MVAALDKKEKSMPPGLDLTVLLICQFPINACYIVRNCCHFSDNIFYFILFMLIQFQKMLHDNQSIISKNMPDIMNGLTIKFVNRQSSEFDFGRNWIQTAPLC